MSEPRWGMGVNTTRYGGARWWLAVVRRWWLWCLCWSVFGLACLITGLRGMLR